MCNPMFLKVFVMACLMNTNYSTTQLNCVKAYDICVDRTLWEIEDTFVSIRDEEEKNKIALEMCEDQLFNRGEFSMYYTDTRCSWPLGISN